MTNAKQRAWIFRDLLVRNPDLIQINSYSVWIRPIRHFIAQIWINSSMNPNDFSPNMSIAPLYWAGATCVSEIGSFNEYFRRESPPAPFTREYFLEPDYEQRPDYPQFGAWGLQVGLWQWTVPEIDRIFVRAVEEQVLPLLRRLALDHRAYLDFYHRVIVRRGGLYPEQRMAIALAAGALDEAREFLGQVWRWYETDSYGAYEPPEEIAYPKRGQRTRAAMEAWDKASNYTRYRAKRRRILEVVEPLRTGDRAALAAILHRWEAEAARIHKVERFWEPTPFPIEERSA